MTAPTAWDDGMDWTIDRTGYPPEWAYAEALRLAIIERATVAVVSVPASLQAVIGPGSPLKIGSGQYWWKSSGNWYVAGWANTTFDALMTTLIPYFVNHTDHDGDWSGQSAQAPAPMWTEAALLTAIGAASRLKQEAAYTGGAFNLPILWAWMKQQYDLLNLLRWTKKTGAIEGGERGEAIFQSGGYYGGGYYTDSWPDAKARSLPWILYGGAITEPIAYYVSSYGTEYNRGGDHRLVMDAGRYKTRIQLAATGLYTGVAHEAQLYARTVSVGAESSDGPCHNTYLDPFGNTENWYFVQEVFGNAKTSRRLSNWVGEDPRFSPTEAWCDEPDKQPIADWGYPDAVNTIGSKIEAFTYVLKWDVADGFAFVTQPEPTPEPTPSA